MFDGDLSRSRSCQQSAHPRAVAFCGSAGGRWRRAAEHVNVSLWKDDQSTFVQPSPSLRSPPLTPPPPHPTLPHSFCPISPSPTLSPFPPLTSSPHPPPHLPTKSFPPFPPPPSRPPPPIPFPSFSSSSPPAASPPSLPPFRTPFPSFSHLPFPSLVLRPRLSPSFSLPNSPSFITHTHRPIAPPPLFSPLPYPSPPPPLAPPLPLLFPLPPFFSFFFSFSPPLSTPPISLFIGGGVSTQPCPGSVCEYWPWRAGAIAYQDGRRRPLISDAVVILTDVRIAVVHPRQPQHLQQILQGPTWWASLGGLEGGDADGGVFWRADW